MRGVCGGSVMCSIRVYYMDIDGLMYIEETLQLAIRPCKRAWAYGDLILLLCFS